jgi:hypothetical protein
MLVFDLETEKFAPGNTAPRPVLAQAANFNPGPDAFTRGRALMCKPGSPTFNALVSEVARSGAVGTNLAFDVGSLLAHGYLTAEQAFDGFDRGVFRSIDTRQRLLDIAVGDYTRDKKYNLGALAARYGVEGIDKASPWRLRFAELEHVPWADWPEDAIEYALGDVTAPEIVFRGQEQERARIHGILGSDPLADEVRATRAHWGLWLVSAHGVKPDREALEYYRAWVERRKKRARQVLLEARLLRLHNGQYKKEQKKMRGLVVERWTKRAKWGSLRQWIDLSDETIVGFQARTGLDRYTINLILDETPITGIAAHKAKIVSDATGGQFVPYPRTDSGKYPSLDEGTAIALDLPELHAWLEYGSAASAESRWSEVARTLCPTHREKKARPGREIGACGVKGCDWRADVIHTRFTLAETGRARSSSPNLQNRPRKGPDRECFAPGPGLVYLVTDHDGLELSAVAQVLIAFQCGDNLARAINSGMDGHLMLGADLLGISYAEAQARYKRGDPEVKHRRQVAKVANFGFPGGLGPPGFVGHAQQNYGLRLTLAEAREIRATWMSRWPEFKKYFRMMSNLTRRGTGTAKQLGSNRLRGGARYTDICNTFFQGLGGDLTSDVLYELQRDCRRTPVVDVREVLEAWAEWVRYGSKTIEALAERVWRNPRDITNALLYGSRVENYVHDEYLLAVSYRPVREGALVVDPVLEAVALAKEYVIRTVSERWLPDMKPTATAAAGVRWSKAARDVRDERGRPIVWEVCPEVDEFARVFGDPELEAKAGPWARTLCERARGCDPVRLHARLAGLVPGYRRLPSERDIQAAIEDSHA